MTESKSFECTPGLGGWMDGWMDRRLAVSTFVYIAALPRPGIRGAVPDRSLARLCLVLILGDGSRAVLGRSCDRRCSIDRRERRR